MIVASYRIECDTPGCTNTAGSRLARAENSAPWDPKDIRRSAQQLEGFTRKGGLDLCPSCSAPPAPTPVAGELFTATT